MKKPYKRSHDIVYILTEAIKYIVIAAAVAFVIIMVFSLW